MIREELERTGSGELLSLEKHGGSRSQEQQRSHGPVPTRTGQFVNALAPGRVGNLVVILEKRDEGGRRQAQRGRASWLLLPEVVLSLVKVTPFQRRDELLGSAQVIAVVGLVTTGQGHASCVMEIVIPETIHAVTALFQR